MSTAGSVQDRAGLLVAVGELSRFGEQAAIGWCDPATLTGLLERSARVFQQAGDYRGAEAQWVRALAIGRGRMNRATTADDHHERDRARADIVRVLESLGGLYRTWGRLHRALDADFELLSVHQRADHVLEVARALTQIGSTMLAADRPDSAVEYLTRADREFRALDPPMHCLHAEAVALLGTAHRRQAHPTRARHCQRRAHALLGDHDGPDAQRVRALLNAEHTAAVT